MRPTLSLVGCCSVHPQPFWRQSLLCRHAPGFKQKRSLCICRVLPHVGPSNGYSNFNDLTPTGPMSPISSEVGESLGHVFRDIHLLMEARTMPEIPAPATEPASKAVGSPREIGSVSVGAVPRGNRAASPSLPSARVGSARVLRPQWSRSSARGCRGRGSMAALLSRRNLKADLEGRAFSPE